MKINFGLSELRNLKIKKVNKKPELNNSEIVKLIRFPSYVTWFFCFHFFQSQISKVTKT